MGRYFFPIANSIYLTITGYFGHSALSCVEFGKLSFSAPFHLDYLIYWHTVVYNISLFNFYIYKIFLNRIILFLRLLCCIFSLFLLHSLKRRPLFSIIFKESVFAFYNFLSFVCFWLH